MRHLRLKLIEQTKKETWNTLLFQFSWLIFFFFIFVYLPYPCSTAFHMLNCTGYKDNFLEEKDHREILTLCLKLYFPGSFLCMENVYC